MNCSGSGPQLIRFATVAIASALAVVGCGGSVSRPDGGRDAGPGGALTTASASLDLGQVAIGKTGTPTAVVINNTGTVATGAPSVMTTGDFTTSGCSAAIPARGMCTLMVTFAPKTMGRLTGTLTVTANPGGMLTISLSGTGGPADGLEITPQNNDFMNVGVGQMSAPFTFTVRNAGTAMVTAITPAISGGEFTIPMGGNKCTALAAAATCTVDVVFAPMSRGVKTATLTVSGMGAAMGSAALRGTAVGAPTLVLNPPDAQIAGAVGETSGPINFTVVNTGDQPTGIPAVSVMGANASEFTLTNGCVAPIPPLGSCPIGVSFRPTAVGMRTATLSVAAMPGGTDTAMLSGTATAASQIVADPTALNFPAMELGRVSAAMPIMVRNGGPVATGALSVTVTAAEFSITSNTCQGAPLAPMATCQLALQFAPTTAGPKSGTVIITGMPGGTRQVSLIGTAIARPSPIFSPLSRDFGSLPLNTESTDFTFTVTNEGGAIPGGVTAVITGLSASQFAITGNTCNAALAAAGTCNVVVRFKPTTLGDKIAMVTVSGGGASGSATVTGSAVMPGQLTIASLGGAFSDTVVGSTATMTVSYTITNTGMVDSGMIAIDTIGMHATSFVVMGNTCVTLAPGGTCMVTVQFRPTTAGSLQGALRATAMGGVSISPLAGRGLAQVELVCTSCPPPQGPMASFGDVVLGQTGPTRTFTATIRVPLTGGMAAITTGAADYNVAGPTACANGMGGIPDSTNYSTVNPLMPATHINCTVTVTFAPKVSKGAKPGVVTFSAGERSVTGSLSGNATGPLQIAPKPFDFGTRMTGSMTMNTFRVTNLGTAELTITATTLAGAEFAKGMGLGDTCMGGPPLAANGGFCDIVVTFAPTSAGEKSATLAVSGTAAGMMESDSVTITGDAMGAVPLITVTPSPGEFGGVALTSSTTRMFTVTNPAAAGTGAITIGTPTNTDYTVTSNTCTGGLAQLPPGGTCTFVVTFAPSIAASGVGPRNGDVTVTAAAATGNMGGPVVVILNGTATQPLAVTPGSHDFGSVVEDDLTGPTREFTITNAGGAFTGAAVIEAGTAPGADAAEFSVLSHTCATIAAGGSCTATVRFHPTDQGLSSAVLVVRNTGPGPGRAVTAATLTGTGVSDAVLQWVNIDQGGAHTRDFGEVRFGGALAEMSSPVTFTLRNTGLGATGALAFNAPFAATDPFNLVADMSTCSGLGSLAAGATCTVTVVFKPTMMGVQSRMLVITAPGRVAGSTKTSTPSITLQGTGIAGTGAVYITPTPIDTGAAFTAEPAAPVMLTFNNNTGLPVTITSIAASNAAVFKTPAQTGMGTCAVAGIIPATATCTFTVVLNPDAGSTPGIHNTTVAVTTSGGTATAAAYGRVRGNAALSISPAPGGTFPYGDVVLNTSTDRSWTVTNTGERETGAMTVAMAGGSDPSFSVLAGSTCVTASNVPAGGNCTITVRFSPTTGGIKNGTINVSAPNASAGAVIGIGITGTGVAAAALTTDVPSRAFAATTVNMSAAPQDVIVRNNAGVLDTQATGPLTITITPSTHFTVAGCDTERTTGLAGGATCTLTVTFTPRTAGAISADLSISGMPGGAPTVVLSGTGNP
jgi:hypothetical protein